jgi:hypothetical protein
MPARPRRHGRNDLGRRTHALQPVEAAVEIEVLGAAALFLLLDLLLELFDLGTQRLHFGLEFADLVEQIEIARAHRGELLLQRGEAVGRTHALCRRRGGEGERESETDGERQTSDMHDGRPDAG